MDAESLLVAFKQDLAPFSLLWPPYDHGLERLRRDRPFLLHSILAIASRRHPTIQDQLEREFREILARKLIIEGARDLDLLQGLLMHLTWYVCVDLSKLASVGLKAD